MSLTIYNTRNRVVPRRGHMTLSHSGCRNGSKNKSIHNDSVSVTMWDKRELSRYHTSSRASRDYWRT
jgi:hypothetical protein